MIKNIKIFFIVFIFSFFIVQNAKAIDLVDQEQLIWVNLTLPTPTWTVVGQNFTPSQNNISGVKFYGQAGTTTTEFVLCSGTPNNSSKEDVEANLMSCNWPFNSTLLHIANATATDNCGGACWQYMFDDPIGLTSGENYYFGIRMELGANDIQVKYNSIIPDGMILNEAQFENTTIYSEYYSTTYIPPLNYVLTPIYPLNSDTIASSTVEISGTYLQPDLTMDYINIRIFDFADNQTTNNYTAIASTSGQFLKKVSLIDGIYEWQAYFGFSIDGRIDTMLWASSTPQIFTVNKMGIQAEVCSGIATSTIMGGIECGFKKVMMWAVTPSQGAMTSLYNSYLDMKEAFPFNAYFGLTDALTEGIGTTTPTMDDNFSMPFITATGTVYMLPIVSSSSMPRLIGQNNTNLFRNSITWILWLMAGSLIFFQFKRI
jgi:hypothetical protein